LTVGRGHARFPVRVLSKLRNCALSPDRFGANRWSDATFDGEKPPPRLARVRLEDGKLVVSIASWPHREEQFRLGPLSLHLDDADDVAFVFYGENSLVPAPRPPEEGVERGGCVELPVGGCANRADSAWNGDGEGRANTERVRPVAATRSWGATCGWGPREAAGVRMLTESAFSVQACGRVWRVEGRVRHGRDRTGPSCSGERFPFEPTLPVGTDGYAANVIK